MKHGEFKDGATGSREYWIWVGMRDRCRNPRAHAYKWYGGKGVKVCERWDDFGVFLGDMGRRPSDKHSIDRIDVNGDYEPSNCRWATPKEQAENKTNRIFIDGLTVEQVMAISGLTYSGVYTRLARGWSVEQMLSGKRDPAVRSSNRHVTIGGVTKTLTAWAREAGIETPVLWRRLENGVAEEKLLLKEMGRRKGTSNPAAKLTEAQVAEIRASSEKGTELAKKYGVSSTLIYAIKKNRIWAQAA